MRARNPSRGERCRARPETTGRRLTARDPGHPRTPRTTWYDGVRFEEVSLGRPREWRRWDGTPRPAGPTPPTSGRAS